MIKIIKNNENAVPYFYPFCYAFSCSCQFIWVVVGFLPSCPLTAHFYVKPAMSLVASGSAASGLVASGLAASSLASFGSVGFQFDYAD